MNIKHTRISRRLVLANAVGALALTGFLTGYGFIGTPGMTSANSQDNSLLSLNAHRTTARPRTRGAALPGTRGAVVSVSLRAA